jgi:cytochrome P450
VGDVAVPAGTVLTLGLGAINRDPSRFDNPEEFQLGRAHVRDHIAFGRGPHACPGAPLARLEAKVTLERFLDRLENIRISEAEHGLPGARRYDYESTFILNGLNSLHLEFDAR